jgi:hypothetical protein
MRRKRNAQRILVGTPEEKRLNRRTRRRWEGNIKLDLKEIGYECMKRTDLAHVRCQWSAVVSTAMNLRVP